MPCEAGVGYGGVGTGGGGVHQQMKPKIGHQEVKSLHLAGDGAPMEDFTKKGNLVGVLGFSLGRVTMGLKERQVEAELGEPRGSLASDDDLVTIVNCDVQIHPGGSWSRICPCLWVPTLASR